MNITLKPISENFILLILMTYLENESDFPYKKGKNNQILYYLGYLTLLSQRKCISSQI